MESLVVEYIRLIREIAADLRARNFKKLLEDVAALLKLIASGMSGTPDNFTSLAAGGSLSISGESVDAVASEFEAFANQHQSEVSAQANGEFIKKAFQLLLKLLPLILAGL